MKIVAIIPARYAATRFPAKLMQPLGSKTVIRHTYENTVATELFDEVWVVTDSPIIYEEITQHGGRALMSQKEHASGSDRIAEAIEHLALDVVVNVQGDEPFIQREPLEKLVNIFRYDTNGSIKVASLMQLITNPEEIANPNVVKVVTDQAGFALYFSRCPVPYNRDANEPLPYYRHIGVYGYRKATLLQFTQWPATPLEMAEKLEQLRLLENGIRIKMAEVKFTGLGIDTPEDLEKAKELIQ